MGAQTLEILRQGLWASLTGGWFYDPHQSVFCNIFHFYLWIALLCFPFSIYLYFPPSVSVYMFYCCSVLVLFLILKGLNHTLHRTFDTAVCYQESVPADELPETQRKRAIALHVTKTILEEEGIELQEMKSSERVAHEQLHEPTDDDSLNSLETAARALSSTIDLKVDVHRKNSSGSSEEARGEKEKEEEHTYVNLSPPPDPAHHSEEVTLRRRGQHKCGCLQKKEQKEPGNNYDMGITANGSCGVLAQTPPNLEQMKNTGSLELPINDYANVTSTEKGLIYWKAHHLESSPCCDKLRKADNVMHLPSEVSLPSASCTFLPISPCQPSEPVLTTEEEQARKFLEEEFDWFQGEYSDSLPSASHSGHLNQQPKFKSDDNILNEKLRANQTMPCLKFQVNSDEDSSDNAGSLCPLLCRHDSLEKQRSFVTSSEAHTAKSCPSVGKPQKPPLTVYQESTSTSTPDDLSGWVVSRPTSSKRESFLGNKKLSLPSKSTTPELTDDVRRRAKDDARSRRATPEQADVDPLVRRRSDAKLRRLTPESGETDTPSRRQSDAKLRRLTPETAEIDESVQRRSDAKLRRLAPEITEAEAPFRRRRAPEDGKPRRLPRRADTEPESQYVRDSRGYLSRDRRSATEPESGLSRDRRSDMMTWSTERMGIEWLFEHTDSDNDVREGRTQELSLATPTPAPWSTPRTVVTKRPHRQRAVRNKRHGTHVHALETEARREAKRLKNERENGIIDEEDPDTHVMWAPQLSGDPPPKDNKAPEWRENRETYDSSSGSTTELSSLLPLSSLLSSLHPPSSPLLAAFLASRRDLPAPSHMPGIDDGQEVKVRREGEERASRSEGGRRNHHRAKNSERSRRSSRGQRSSRNVIPLTSVVAVNTHIAQSHNDTTQGAVHCYQDEMGNWWSYTFDPHGTAGSTEPVLQERAPRSSAPHRYKPPHHDSNVNLASNTTSENESCMSASPRLPRAVRRSSSNTQHTASSHSSSALLSRGDSNNNPNNMFGVGLARQRSLAAPDTEEICRHPIFSFLTPPLPLTKNYYKFYLGPWHHIKIRFDRLQLVALLDRNSTFFESFLSVFLSVLVSICGILLLSYGFYRDLFAFALCVTIAGCHYSLLKSVQPDAASPTHGFNRVVIYSRAVYFCLTSGAILGLTALLEEDIEPQVTIYSVDLTSKELLFIIRDILATLLLFFPLFFTLGLFPQVNTFALYLLEQVDVHVFGGNGAPSVLAAFYSVLRSILTIFLLFGFAYGALCERKQSQHILFSIFVTLVVTWSYHLSRSASDPSVLWTIVKDEFLEKPKIAEPCSGEAEGKKEEFEDPLPGKLKHTVHNRLINDVIVCGFMAFIVLGIHCSAVFTTLQPDLNKILWIISGCCGVVIHYMIPQLRKQLPWLCISRPVLRSHEHGKFEVLEAAKVMWFEEMVVVLCFLERNILYPVLVLAIMTSDAPKISDKFGPLTGALVTTVCGVKVMRACFSHCANQYLVVGFTALLLQLDYHAFSETFLVDYFFVNIVFAKTYEFLLKVQFVVTYIAPWQITWGSAFHAFAQPFSVPHSAILFVQAAISALLSAPLNPFLGSAIFLISYVRPVKFWERDYNTKRVDQSNTRLSSHLDRNLGSDDNNLNSIFYEHLTRSLQHSLCGDLMMGRWGPVSQGDCYVLASDYLNCLVHIIEMGNGLVTFQMRGLEFRGTYCQQREVEAISEGVEENEGCCCCEPGHVPHVLSVNAAFSQRWLAWEVMATKYVLEGYSISDNSAASMLQVFDFRKVLVTYYVKGIVWYCLRSPRLDDWLTSRAISAALVSVSDRSFVDLDPVFNVNIDQDFDFRAEGITRSSFCNVYFDWIQFCASKLDKSVDKSRESPLVSLCLALSLMGRRALGTASHNTVSSVEFFLYGLHALFKGDFRITSIRDEWVFSDMDLLKRVVAPAVRISLKLHQDHFMSPEEYEESSALYSAIEEHDANLVISHEGDPAWRGAVLSGTPSLLALRHVLDDGTDEYKVIMLNKRFLSFRVIKLNRECVRGLWAGQQQELVFLRNRNPERGSIQNAKQALRNMINSSCDQPIGYPIYVSPLTTSYADTHDQLSSIIGGPVSLHAMRSAALRLWHRIRHRCRQGCSSGSVSRDDHHMSFGNDGVYAMTQVNIQSGYGHSTSGSQSMDSSQIQLGGSNRGGSLGRSSLSGRGSFPTTGKPSSSTLVSLAGLLTSTELAKAEGFLRERETSFTSIRERPSRDDCCRRHEERREGKEGRKERKEVDDGSQRVRIVDPKQVFDAINLGRRIDVLWPDEHMRSRGGRSYWKHWLPDTNMEGVVVHRWVPHHRDPGRRSHVDKTILLMKIGDRFVPIAESGVEPVPDPDPSPPAPAAPPVIQD